MGRVRSLEIHMNNVRASYTDDGVYLIIDGTTKNDVAWCIRVRVWFCYLADFAETLWKFVDERQEKIERIKRALRREKP